MSYLWLALKTKDHRYHPRIQQVRKDRYDAPYTDDVHRVDELSHSKDPVTLSGLLNNDNVKSHHIDRIARHHDPVVLSDAMEHHLTSAKAIDRVLNKQSDKYALSRELAVMHKNASPDQLYKALDDPQPSVRRAAISNKHVVRDEHFRKAFEDKDISVVSRAVSRKGCPVDVLDKAINHPDPIVRTQMFNNYKGNVSPHHIGKGLSDNNKNVRMAAAGHSAATSSQIHSALDDPEPGVRAYALYNDSATKAHYDRGLRDTNKEVADTARYMINTRK